MMIILFGYPAAGKTFVGEIIQKDFGFHFYDGDDDLTPEVKELIKQEKSVTDELREVYFQKVIEKLTGLRKKHKNIVFAQALTREKHRWLIKKHFPKATFILVKARAATVRKRLQTRKHLITQRYAEKVIKSYEKPKIPCTILINDGTKEKIKQQIRNILKTHS